ncbi:hypothetical protein Poly30_51010 [Planctomycetes bacterium Poly30]|uniref:AhpC/TSA family protein n=2 Tax=Saltatorellus ferox TaxID=2528018 RepID=A0A518EZM5_9BACT|nr:hypothetical protein Poly30_51010 [Planctomycetes bacterium Poly30]
MGSPEEGKTFLSERWPEAIAISDPDRTLFRAFDLGRASLGQVFGLRVWKEALKVARFGVGKPVGDPLALGGTFLVHGAHVLASDIAEHAGHVPDYEGMIDLARIRSNSRNTRP